MTSSFSFISSLETSSFERLAISCAILVSHSCPTREMKALVSPLEHSQQTYTVPIPKISSSASRTEKLKVTQPAESPDRRANANWALTVRCGSHTVDALEENVQFQLTCSAFLEPSHINCLLWSFLFGGGSTLSLQLVGFANGTQSSSHCLPQHWTSSIPQSTLGLLLHQLPLETTNLLSIALVSPSFMFHKNWINQ